MYKDELFQVVRLHVIL